MLNHLHSHMKGHRVFFFLNTVPMNLFIIFVCYHYIARTYFILADIAGCFFFVSYTYIYIAIVSTFIIVISESFHDWECQMIFW